MIELKFTIDEYETILFTRKGFPPRIGDYIWWKDREFEVCDIYWNMDDRDEHVVVSMNE